MSNFSLETCKPSNPTFQSDRVSFPWLERFAEGLEAAGVAAQCGIVSEFPLNKIFFNKTVQLRETLLKGKSTIAEAISSQYCEEGCGFEVSQVRAAILNRVIKEEDRIFFNIAPTQFYKVIKEREEQLRQLGVGPIEFMMQYRSLFVPHTSVALRIETTIPSVGYAFSCIPGSNDHIILKEELVAGDVRSDLYGPYSRTWQKEFDTKA